MKRQILFSFVVSIFLFTAGQANAVLFGDNVGSPRISLLPDYETGSNYGQFVAGGALEIGSSNHTQTPPVLGLGGRYHITTTEQIKYLPLAAGAAVLYPVLSFVTPDVFTATGAVAPGFSSLSHWGGWYGGGGGATSAGVQYLVQGTGFRVRNNATGAFVGRFMIRAVNGTTKLVVWTKTYVDGALYINPRTCEVTDIDGDGNDEVVLQFIQRTSPTTVYKILQMFNLATGVQKGVNRAWVDNE